MKVHLLALVLIIGLALSIPSVSAKIVEEKNGYVVSTIDEGSRFTELVSRGTYSLTQGQARGHTVNVAYGSTTFNADLNWGTASNSLTLTVYLPNYESFGPYSDTIDGRNDGRIPLTITRSSGLPSGSWNSLVYGQSITGTQMYSFSPYAY